MYKASNQVGRQHGYIRVSELSDRKKYRRVLKAVDAGELVKPNSTDGDASFYTLQGVKVSRPVKGVYIHNGKKFIK